MSVVIVTQFGPNGPRDRYVARHAIIGERDGWPIVDLRDAKLAGMPIADKHTLTARDGAIHVEYVRDGQVAWLEVVE